MVRRVGLRSIGEGKPNLLRNSVPCIGTVDGECDMVLFPGSLTWHFLLYFVSLWLWVSVSYTGLPLVDFLSRSGSYCRFHLSPRLLSEKTVSAWALHVLLTITPLP